MTLRVLLLIRSLEVGGAERQLVLLANALAARGNSVAVVTLYPGGDLANELVVDVRRYSLDKGSRWDLARPLARLVRVMRLERPNVVHGYMATGNLLALLSGMASRNTATLWGIRSAGMDLSIYDRFSRLLSRLETACSRWPDHIVVNSQRGKAELIAKGFPAERVAVIHNGIDLERFVPDDDRRRLTRRSWNIEDGSPLIGVVSRLDPIKGHVTFLEAAALLLESVPSATFVLVGSGPEVYKMTLIEQSRRLRIRSDRLRFVGIQADVCAAYNALDLLVSASTAEGFPNSLAEGMACGVRCVATSVGESSLIVGHWGKVVPVGDFRSLARACEDMLAARPVDPQELRNHVARLFGVDSLARATEDLMIRTSTMAPPVRSSEPIRRA